MTLGLNATWPLSTPYFDLNGGPTANTSFVTIEQYMAATGQTVVPGSVEEERIMFLLDSACTEIRGELHQQLDLVAGDVIYLDGTGFRRMLLPQCPVLDVTEVLKDEGEDTEELITDFKGVTGNISLRDSGILYRRLGWKLGVGNYKVTYDHGYAVMPTDLVNVAINMARTNIAVAPGAIVSETIGGYSYTRGDVTQATIEPYLKVLTKYKIDRIPVA